MRLNPPWGLYESGPMRPQTHHGKHFNKKSRSRSKKAPLRCMKNQNRYGPTRIKYQVAREILEWLTRSPTQGDD